MNSNSAADQRLVERALAADETALAVLFEQYRARLKRMVRLRMDRRLQGRLDASDVLQEAYLDLAHRLPEYAESARIPIFLWMRLITGQRLLQVHRRHLGTAMRDAQLEVSLYRKAMPQASTEFLASQLLGKFTSVSQRAIRAEQQIKLQETLNAMDDTDREVLALRHFEELSNGEIAQVLEISTAAASKRYLRALKRLKLSLANVSGPRVIDRSIPRDLETIVLKCVDAEARRRYQSADELAEDLQRFISDEPIRARRVSPVERLARWARRNRAIASLAVTVVSLLFFGSIVFAGLWAKERESREVAEEEVLRRTIQVTATYLNEEAFAQFRHNLVQIRAATEDADHSFELGHMLKMLDVYEQNTCELNLPYIPSRIVPIPSRNWVAIAHGSSPAVTVWDLVAGKEVKRYGADHSTTWGNLHGFRYEVCIAASPDGRSLVYTDESEKRLMMVDLDKPSSQIPVVIAESEMRFTTVAFAPDGTHFAAFDEDTVVRTFSYPAREATGEFRVGPSLHTKGVGSIAYSDDSAMLATVVAGRVEVRELKTQQVIYAYDHEWSGVHDIAFCPGRTFLFVVGKALVRHDYAQDVRTVFNWDTGYSVCVSRDGSTVASGGGRRVVELWDADSGRLVQSLRGHWGSSKGVTFLKTSSKQPYSLASVGYDRKLILWRLDKPRDSAVDEVICTDKLPSRITWALYPEHDFAFLPNKKELVVKAHGMVTVLESQAPFTLCHAWDWDVALRALAVSDSGLIAVGDDAGDVHILDSDLQKISGLPCPHPDSAGKWVFALSFIGNDNQIAVGRQDGTVEVWDTRNLRVIADRQLHEGRVFQIKYVPGREQLVSVAPGEVSLWDAEFNAVRPLRASKLDRFSEDLAVSPEENFLAVVSPFAGTFIWDLRKPTIPAHHCLTPGRGVAFSDDGQTLFVMGGALHILDLRELADGGRPKFKISLNNTGSAGGRTEMSPDGTSLYVLGSLNSEPVLNIWRSE